VRHETCTAISWARREFLALELGENAMSSFKTIIVPVDFSETSDEAWRVACDVARLAASTLHLVHVTPEPFQQPWAIEAMAVDLEALTLQWMNDSKAKLEKFVAPSGIDAERITRIVLRGVPQTRITEYAADQGADLIVMGTHGYGPLKHLLLGSVAERVVRHAACPVLTVPHRSLRPQSRQRERVTTAV
jgi:nucleotide-binding universal stress UspA family protein